MKKQWIAILSLTALLIAGSLAGSALAQTASPSDTDSAVAGEERGHDSDGDGANEEEGRGGDPSEAEEDLDDGAKPGKGRFVELLAENLGISEDETQAALDATYEQLKAERRAAWEQAVRDALAKAVEAGKITQEQADAKLAEFLDGDSDSARGFGKRGHHGFKGGRGHGGWFGKGWGADKDSAESGATGESGDSDEDAAA